MKTRSRFINSHKPVMLISMLALMALILVACQSKATPTATQVPAAPAPTNTTAPTVEEPTIMVATDPKLGQILVDGKGMTLYLFTNDTSGVSNCNAGCLAKWPPLLTAGSPKAGDGVNASLLGSAKLADGRMIVSYNGMPLYYWINDTKPGDTTGEGVGSVWFVVSPAGMKVEPPAVSTATPTATPAAAVEEPTIMIATDSKLGQILVDGKGMTLYLFTKDMPGVSNCNAGCLAKWPPLLTAGSPKAGDGVNASLLGSVTLADGRKIVTYNQKPLYYWVNDTKAGDTTGEDVGGVWYVVSPAGEAVKPPASATDTPAAPAAGGEPTLMVATDPKLGQILVDGKGMTLYLFTKDTPDHSNCNAGCLAKWPPLLTQGHPVAGPGIDGTLLSTTTLTDGRMIVTYNHKPLYYWVNDKKAGDTTGEGVGSVWFVVSPAGEAVQPPAAFEEPTIMVATDPKLGKILVDGKGMTLYIYTVDKPNQSNCTGGCLAKWPPLLTQGHPVAGTGVNASLLGTATLADGRMIVTYNGMPLYYWVNDTKAGDTTGQGVGSVWFVIGPDGKVIGN